MAIYRHQNDRAIVEIPPEVRLSNQVTLYGTDPLLSVSNGIFFLELLISDKLGTVTIKDGEGRTMATGITEMSQDFLPLRCDYGIEILGDVSIAKGFVIEGVFV